MQIQETIKTPAFDPEILKRYVNFMNNPDEETAVEQFGKGRQVLRCMYIDGYNARPSDVRHGQIEGFSEKYGMEYVRAYKDEKQDTGFIEAHNMFIFPLLKKRAIFAEVYYFRLYDIIDNNGNVNENVFAYTNRYGNDIFTVIYNNSIEGASGTLKSLCRL